jgi:hypothetical protein
MRNDAEQSGVRSHLLLHPISHTGRRERAVGASDARNKSETSETSSLALFREGARSKCNMTT